MANPPHIFNIVSRLSKALHIFFNTVSRLFKTPHIFFNTVSRPPKTFRIFHIFRHCSKVWPFTLHASRLPELREENPKTSPENLINTFCLQIGPEGERIR